MAAELRTVPEQPPAEPQTPEEYQALLGALVVILMANLPVAEAEALAAPILAPLGVAADVVKAAGLFALVLPHFERPPSEVSGPALFYTASTEPARHAQFLVAAGRRLTVNPESDERANLERHLNAMHQRVAAAVKVDNAASVWGPRLGWHATLDERTTAECRAAHGHNFEAARPPVIGYPGQPHGGTCRCRPGRAHADGGTVDEATAGVHHT